MTNRPIKFRAWDRLNKLIVYPGSGDGYMQCDGDGFTLTVETGVDIDRETGMESPNYEEIEADFMQFTGLTDKNGKEIYEGDVVKARGIQTKNDVLGDVRWNNKEAALKLYLTRGGSARLDAIFRHEVIGNIYENPELLT